MAWPADFDLAAIEYRLWPKIHITPDCWGWLVKKTRDGYGQISILGKHQLAHRVVYTLLKGPIPEGLTLDHLCRNRSCVNPDHLEAVPMKINVHRGDSPWGKNAQKTECSHGHSLTGNNLYIDSESHRHCIICTNITPKSEWWKTAFLAPARHKNHCHRGHELSGINVLTKKDGRRNCRECQLIANKLYEAKPEVKAHRSEYQRLRKSMTKQER